MEREGESKREKKGNPRPILALCSQKHKRIKDDIDIVCLLP